MSEANPDALPTLHEGNARPAGGIAPVIDSAEALGRIASTLTEIRDVLAELRDHAQVLSKKNAPDQFRAKSAR
jgi:hypothetical protein